MGIEIVEVLKNFEQPAIKNPIYVYLKIKVLYNDGVSQGTAIYRI